MEPVDQDFEQLNLESNSQPVTPSIGRELAQIKQMVVRLSDAHSFKESQVESILPRAAQTLEACQFSLNALTRNLGMSGNLHEIDSHALMKDTVIKKFDRMCEAMQELASKSPERSQVSEKCISLLQRMLEQKDKQICLQDQIIQDLRKKVAEDSERLRKLERIDPIQEQMSVLTEVTTLIATTVQRFQSSQQKVFQTQLRLSEVESALHQSRLQAESLRLRLSFRQKQYNQLRSSYEELIKQKLNSIANQKKQETLRVILDGLRALECTIKTYNLDNQKGFTSLIDKIDQLQGSLGRSMGLAGSETLGVPSTIEIQLFMKQELDCLQSRLHQVASEHSGKILKCLMKQKDITHQQLNQPSIHLDIYDGELEQKTILYERAYSEDQEQYQSFSQQLMFRQWCAEENRPPSTRCKDLQPEGQNKQSKTSPEETVIPQNLDRQRSLQQYRTHYSTWEQDPQEYDLEWYL